MKISGIPRHQSPRERSYAGRPQERDRLYFRPGRRNPARDDRLRQKGSEKNPGENRLQKSGSSGFRPRSSPCAHSPDPDGKRIRR